MKKIITAICIMALCLSTMPVMASETTERTERIIDKGGMTVSFPDTYSSYTASEVAMGDIKSGAKNVYDFYKILPDDDDIQTGAIIGGVIGTLLGTWMDVTKEFPDNAELLIYDDTGNYAFEIFCMNDSCMELDDWPWYTLSRELLSDSPENADHQLMNFLRDLGYYEEVYLFDGIPAKGLKKAETNDENKMPYLYIDEVSNSGGSCCRLAEIMYNGYENRVLFMDNNESELSEEALDVFNEFMDSISISPSLNKPERASEKYQRFLHDRVDIID